ncbi:Si-specific NAD(P)(+) transhydrogenase [bacterium]|nr:Si-specific NAD(P)(+) transhydrogenase [bacterium]
MSDTIYDIAVIGSGPSGEKAALEAASLGAGVVVIEKGIRPGGASVITGTIPSKSLRETVKHVEMLSGSQITGIDFKLNRSLTIPELMHHKNNVITDRVGDILETYKENGITYVFGKARFQSPYELSVVCTETERPITIKAKKFIVAVGTNPYHPPGIQFDGTYILDSDTILQLKKIPETLVVIGGGVIGCEYTSIFCRLGTKVSLVDPSGTLLNFVDHDISDALASQMKKDGVKLCLGCNYTDVKVVDEAVNVQLDNGDIIEASAILFANGRQGMADELNLEVCGLEINRRNQLEVNDNYQTKVPHIYAVGDVIGFPSLVSVSNEEGRMAARSAVLGEATRRVGSDIPYGIYTIPEISMIGPTEKQLIEKKIPYGVGTCQFKDLARGLIIGDRKGMLKLLFNRETHEMLAVHMFGQSAAELVHIAQAVIHYKGKIDYFLENVFNFPTLSAAFKVAARQGLMKKNNMD